MNRHLNFVTLICLITGFVSLASCSNDDDEMDKYQRYISERELHRGPKWVLR